ncbi:DcuS/MalK family sensor histidine kinase [Ammoniphilus resinae]|uniref:histidine kinase n=1 Tax=Ammoniphilus resinae TaxID=861532 RepID=A0ABS4GWQ9_9BACL|nr:CitB family two-component system sensor histidine kinase MalK [Ammoniphilus resinae]
MAGIRQTSSLLTTITTLVCIVVALSLFVTDALIVRQVEENTRDYLSEKATNIARVVAHSPTVVEGLQMQMGESRIQPFADEMRRVSGVEFIVVMDMNGIRKSHPDPAKVGKHFAGGDEGAALNGQEYVSTGKGTLGMSLRAFTPVRAQDGKQIGVVVVGITLNRVQSEVSRSRVALFWGIGMGGLVGIAGALLLARRIKKILFGLEPRQIAKLLQERSAILDATREGIIAIDSETRITLVNSEGRRLFQRGGLSEDPLGKPIKELIPETRLDRVLKNGQSEHDQEIEVYGIPLIVNRVPIYLKQRIVGGLMTFRDKTDIKRMAEELTGIKLYAGALRAQTHEFMNKLHVILGMVHLGAYDQLTKYINQTARQYQQDVGFILRRVKNTVLAGFLLGKNSFVREAGAELILVDDAYIPDPEDSEIIHEWVTILGNLIDNAVDAMKDREQKKIFIDAYYDQGMLTMEVEDTGKGFDENEREHLFKKGYSTKKEEAGERGLGLYLVKQIVGKRGGSIEVFSQVGEGSRFLVHIPLKVRGTELDQGPNC